MTLKLNTPSFPIFTSSLFSNTNPRGPSEIRFSNRWGNEQQRKVLQRSLSHSLALLDHQSFRRRDHQTPCGGDDDHVVLETGVWWDLNTCPVPDGFDPRCVRPCIEAALEKQIGRRSAVSIYAFGNLEYISSDLLEIISSSGIILTHTPCGGHDIYEFLDDWSGDELKTRRYIMMISGDYEMLYPERFRRYGFTTFVALPDDVRLISPLHQLKVIGQEFDKVFAKKFVWETLLSDNLDETLLLSHNYNNACNEKPRCICNICNEVYQVCDEFTTHLKSEEHRNRLFEIVVDRYGKPKHFCQVCNYPAYDAYNLFLHNESEEHKSMAQEEEDCESSETNPEFFFFYERKRQFL